MAKLSLGAWGMLLMMANGTIGTLMASSGKLLLQFRYQYFHMMAVSDSLVVLSFIIGIAIARAPVPSAREAVWLFLRGFFGSSSLLLLIIAVRVGASPGDAAALGSINTVIATLLGRLFLGESFGSAHCIAIAFAVAGAVLISKPSFLFAGPPAEINVYLGYFLAAASGFMKACVFIAGRKCSKVSLWYSNLSPALFCTLAFSLLPLMPFVDEPSSGRFHEPLCIVIVLVLFIVHAMAMYSQSAASKHCKAAIGATSNTFAAMVTGYIVQTVLFDKAPELMSIAGAVLMFASVIIMAVTRVPERQQAPPDTGLGAACPNAWENVSTLASGEDDDSQSLVSFIATEYVEYAAREKTTVRLRNPAAVAPGPAAQTVGAMMSVVASAS